MLVALNAGDCIANYVYQCIQNLIYGSLTFYFCTTIN